MPHSSKDRLTDDLMDARVVDAGGVPATVVSVRQHEGEASGPDAQLRLADGTQVLVPLDFLTFGEDGIYRLPFSFRALEGQGSAMQLRFPVVHEELQVARRTVDTGRGVRLRKTVSEREQIVDDPLWRDELAVEHIPVGRVIAEAEMPQTHYEGDTLVVPVLEEVLVVQKQLLLKEEVRITRQRQTRHQPQKVLLRSEQIDVERFDEQG